MRHGSAVWTDRHLSLPSRCDAYFSETDLKNSCPWYSFVVISVQDGKFHHANSFLPDIDQTQAETEELIWQKS